MLSNTFVSGQGTCWSHHTLISLPTVGRWQDARYPAPINWQLTWSQFNPLPATRNLPAIPDRTDVLLFNKVPNLVHFNLSMCLQMRHREMKNILSLSLKLAVWKKIRVKTFFGQLFRNASLNGVDKGVSSFSALDTGTGTSARNMDELVHGWTGCEVRGAGEVWPPFGFQQNWYSQAKAWPPPISGQRKRAKNVAQSPHLWDQIRKYQCEHGKREVWPKMEVWMRTL